MQAAKQGWGCGSLPVTTHLLPSSAPSMITWPPVSWSFWYSSANQEEGLSDTKLVFSSSAPGALLVLARQQQKPFAGLLQWYGAAFAAGLLHGYAVLTYPLDAGRSLSVDPTICFTRPCNAQQHPASRWQH
jgi:hypothetical protein